MNFIPEANASVNLEACGLHPAKAPIANAPAPVLVELSLARRESLLIDNGALAAYTGERTGRSPKDRYVVRDSQTDSLVDWGSINQPIEPEQFDRILKRVQDYLNHRELFVCDGAACADPAHRLRVRVVSEQAWHTLFSQCLFLRPGPAELARFQPDWHILVASDLRLDPARDGRGPVFVGIDFTNRVTIIAGTQYAGEIKKSVFSILNYLLPQRDVFSMHCAANVGSKSDVALFFGLSGTGKTTLSADPHRRLIGDDEHGWSSEGVFNIEGGCYAKTIRLSRQGEPQIWNAIRFGSVLENVVVDPVTRLPDYNSTKFTENTRAAYPVEFIPNCELSGRGRHPTNIFLFDLRRLWRLAAIEPVGPAPGDVPFSVRLYGESRGHGNGRDRAGGRIQHLFRGPVPAAAANALCGNVAGENG